MCFGAGIYRQNSFASSDQPAWAVKKIKSFSKRLRDLVPWVLSVQPAAVPTPASAPDFHRQSFGNSYTSPLERVPCPLSPRSPASQGFPGLLPGEALRLRVLRQDSLQGGRSGAHGIPIAAAAGTQTSQT